MTTTGRMATSSQFLVTFVIFSVLLLKLASCEISNLERHKAVSRSSTDSPTSPETSDDTRYTLIWRSLMEAANYNRFYKEHQTDADDSRLVPEELISHRFTSNQEDPIAHQLEGVSENSDEEKSNLLIPGSITTKPNIYDKYYLWSVSKDLAKHESNLPHPRQKRGIFKKLNKLKNILYFLG